MGSSPTRSTFAGIAQLVEHLPSKQRVAGSSPVSRSIQHMKNNTTNFLVSNFAYNIYNKYIDYRGSGAKRSLLENKYGVTHSLIIGKLAPMIIVSYYYIFRYNIIYNNILREKTGSNPVAVTRSCCRRANRIDRGFGTKPYDLWNRRSSARYGEIVHLGRAAQMADGHWTVNPAHRNAGGSNPSSPTTNDIVMVEGKSTTENSTKSHRGQLRLFLNLKSPGNPLALSIPKLTWKQQPARSRNCLLSRSFAYCELRSELSVSA